MHEEEAPHHESGPTACHQGRAHQSEHGCTQRDLVGGDRQVTEQMARDEERHRLVQTARDESQITPQQLGKDGALGAATPRLINDAHGAFEGSVGGAHLVGTHFDGARELFAQSR